MRSFYLFLLISVIITASYSCNPEKNTNKHIIDVASALSDPVEFKASDYFSRVIYIPLETNDSSLIGNNPTIHILSDHILVMARQKCLLFDKSNGNFIRTIGHVGNDPGGYQNVNCIVDEANNKLLFPGWNNDLVVYDLEGNYQGKIDIKLVSGTDSSPNRGGIVLGKDLYAGYYSNVMGDQSNKILFFDGLGETLRVIKNHLTLQPLQIENVAVWAGDEAAKLYGIPASKGLIHLFGKDPDTGSIEISGVSPFWRHKNNTYFKENYSDTIYQIEGTTLTPYLTYELGEYAWPYQDRFKTKPDQRIFISQNLEGENIILFRFIIGLYDNNGRKLYDGIFDKHTGKTIVSLSDKGFKDDLTHFLPFQPTTVSSSGEYGSILSVDKVKEWFDKYGSNEAALSSEIRLLRSVKEDDNPIVVLYQ